MSRVYIVMFEVECLLSTLQGITIKPLVKLIKVKKDNEQKPTMNEVIHSTVSVQLKYMYFIRSNLVCIGTYMYWSHNYLLY